MARGSIAVFDSGVGGLTVVRALRARLPHEALIYLGDTARLPYGTKSAATIVRYALACGRLLARRGAKLLVVACNTASAYALPALAAQLAVPVVGVIAAGAAAAAAAGGRGPIGVLATEATVASRCYEAALARVQPGRGVVARACPMWVPLAEAGLADHAAARLLVADDLRPLLAAGCDTLLLGCTHYPQLAATVGAAAGPAVRLVDGSAATAAAVADLLDARGLRAPARLDVDRFLATDLTDRLARVGSSFLGAPLGPIELVEVGDNVAVPAPATNVA